MRNDNASGGTRDAAFVRRDQLCLNLVHSRLMCTYFPPMTRFARRAALLCMASLIEFIFVFPNLASTADLNPLRPVDTSSPRGTLQDFIASMDQIYLGTKDVLQEYAASQRLYLTPEERRKQVGVLSTAGGAIKVLDLSDIPLYSETLLRPSERFN